MRRGVLLSMAAMSTLFANDTVNLPQVSVEEKINNKVVKDVSSEEIKSADLAEALLKNSAAISMIRRSGIANDIVIRGQKRDNINVIIDGAKVYGACPNRMDPPTSHVLTNNIESVTIQEGPYDIENFGTLSGLVEVKTKEPQKGIHGEVNFNMGSYGYQKVSGTVSGGTDRIKFLLSMSKEESEQYEDGSGNTLAQQTEKSVPSTVMAGMNNNYQDRHKDMDAYSKKTLLSKLYFKLTDDQDIKLAYTANRSDDVLYANSGMDALRDDSDIFDIKYQLRDLGSFSKTFDMNYYYSKVEHPMSTRYRVKKEFSAMGEVVNDMTSKIKGLRVKNALELGTGLLTVGVDGSDRSWEGEYFRQKDQYLRDSLSKADTDNRALFAKYDIDIGNFNIQTGMRYDDTSIDTQNSAMRDRDFESFSANVFTTYQLDENTKFFAGFGKATRVPDARELYFVHVSGAVRGNDDLDQTDNYEIDLGIEKIFGDLRVNVRTFYSDLKDYIYYNGTNSTFENVDAKVYGIQLSGDYYFTDNLFLDYGMAYLRGKKDNALDGQDNTDLADIAPLKGNLGLTYELAKHTFKANVMASDTWDTFDEDNGEQRLGGYAVVNLKYNNQLTKAFDFTIGVDNLFDKTYALSNTYNDLTLVSTGSENMLLNEPGRYMYVNLRYKF